MENDVWWLQSTAVFNCLQSESFSAGLCLLKYPLVLPLVGAAVRSNIQYSNKLLTECSTMVRWPRKGGNGWQQVHNGAQTPSAPV